jgi:hypothetical protein
MRLQELRKTTRNPRLERRQSNVTYGDLVSIVVASESWEQRSSYDTKYYEKFKSCNGFRFWIQVTDYEYNVAWLTCQYRSVHN